MHIQCHTLEIYMVRKLVDLGNFKYFALFVPNNLDLVSQHDVQILNMILWFGCLDQNVPE